MIISIQSTPLKSTILIGFYKALVICIFLGRLLALSYKSYNYCETMLIQTKVQDDRTYYYIYYQITLNSHRNQHAGSSGHKQLHEQIIELASAKQQSYRG